MSKNSNVKFHEGRLIFRFLFFLASVVVIEILSLEFFHLTTPMSTIQTMTASGESERIISELGSQSEVSSIADENRVMINEFDAHSSLNNHTVDFDKLSIHDSTPLRSLDQILRTAGVNLTDEILHSLPSIEDVRNMYGSKPVIYGLDQCDEFQSSIGIGEEYLAPAGMFNTGTNLLESMLVKNCLLPKHQAKGPGLRYQIPWGKHSPVSWKYKHTAPGFEGLKPEAFLPALVIKDPFTWMDSMCRHKYAANWQHFEGHCPNLVTIDDSEKQRNGGGEVIKVRVHYRDTNITNHESMIHLWNDYYGAWMATKFPKLVVRFEDLLFHAEEIATKVCKCARGKMKDGPFRYVVDSAKKGKAHDGSNGLVKSLTKYAKESNRLKSITPQDMEFLQHNINTELMETFHYSMPS